MPIHTRFIGLNPVYNTEKDKEVSHMFLNFLTYLLPSNCRTKCRYASSGSHAQAAALRSAGLSEHRLRKMDPDQRVAALEKANLDPYDYIYLAC